MIQIPEHTRPTLQTANVALRQEIGRGLIAASDLIYCRPK